MHSHIVSRRSLILAAGALSAATLLPPFDVFAQVAPDNQAVSEGAPMSDTPTREGRQTSGVQATKERGDNGAIIPGQYRMTIPDTGIGGQKGWRPRNFGKGEFKVTNLKVTGTAKVRSMGTNGEIDITQSPVGDSIAEYDVVDGDGKVVEHVKLRIRVVRPPRRAAKAPPREKAKRVPASKAGGPPVIDRNSMGD